MIQSTRKWAVMLGVLIFGGIIASMWMADHPFEIYQRKPLPAMTLQTVDGQPLNTADWQPPYIINFFASWCGPCQQELPQLTQLAKELPLYGIAWQDSPEALTAWLAEHNPPFTAVTMDINAELYRTLLLGGVPITIIVDRAGVIAHYHQGGVQESDMLALKRAIFDVR